MKIQSKKIVAAALAMSMCVPTAAFAAESDSAGSFTTSFGVYSPALTISVPVNLDIKVNPIADSNATDVRKFSIASNSIDIANASVDVDADQEIPVVATIKASITSKGEGVVTEYNTFGENSDSTKKRVHLDLSEAQTAAVYSAKAGETLAFTTEKKLNLGQFEVGTKAIYATPAANVPITKYGSLLVLNIDGPATSDTTTNATFSTDPEKVTPAVGSFAVTGVANTNADWKEDDIAVAVTYNVKASNEVTLNTPAIASAPTFNSASPADLVITVPNVGEATVFAVGCHNDNEGAYGDYNWDTAAYTVTYAPNATTTTQTDATITFKKEDEGLSKFLAGDDYKTKPQDFIIGLSDGRMVVTTLTVN